MTIEEAIKTAIDYENKVRDVYREAVSAAEHETGRRLFQLMADEEQHHVEYLEHVFKKWQEIGELSTEGLRTSVPSAAAISSGVSKIKSELGERPSGAELDYLKRAQAVEVETSGFYRQMVEELPEEARKLFSRFLDIEEGHLAIVKAQIDHVAGTGYWFDVREFDLEG